jgi:hypothetical protein
MVLPGPLPTTVPICTASVSTLLDTPQTIAAVYLDLSQLPMLIMRLRVVLSTTDAAVGREAVIDLYDTNGILNGGVPGIVAGSEIDTTTGSPPPGGPATDPLEPSAYEVDLASSFFGYSGKGTFELRLRINAADGVEKAWCHGAALAVRGNYSAPIVEILDPLAAESFDIYLDGSNLTVSGLCTQSSSVSVEMDSGSGFTPFATDASPTVGFIATGSL